MADMEEDKRKMYSNMKFQMEYRRNGGDWEYTVDMPHGVSKTFRFRIGEPYDSTTLDGRPILVSWDLSYTYFLLIYLSLQAHSTAMYCIHSPICKLYNVTHMCHTVTAPLLLHNIYSLLQKLLTNGAPSQDADLEITVLCCQPRVVSLLHLTTRVGGKIRHTEWKDLVFR